MPTSKSPMLQVLDAVPDEVLDQVLDEVPNELLDGKLHCKFYL